MTTVILKMVLVVAACHNRVARVIGEPDLARQHPRNGAHRAGGQERHLLFCHDSRARCGDDAARVAQAPCAEDSGLGGSGATESAMVRAARTPVDDRILRCFLRLHSHDHGRIHLFASGDCSLRRHAGDSRTAPCEIPVAFGERWPVCIVSNSKTRAWAMRFIVIEKTLTALAAAFDACSIFATAQGYYQKGPEVICRNCASAIVMGTIGTEGGCNPIRFGIACRWRNARDRCRRPSKKAELKIFAKKG